MSSLKHWNTAASRLYYSCFYAASAYLVIHSINASTHAGIKTAFNKHLIKEGKLASKFGQLYNELFALRQDADYRDYRDLTEEKINELFPETKALVIALEKLIET